MKILKVVQAYYPFQEMGGPVVKVRALTRGLAKRGHEVTVLTADLGLSRRKPSDVQVKRTAGGWRSNQDGIETIYLDTLGRYRALTINPAVLGFCRSRGSEFDVTHFYGLYDVLGPTVSYVCRANRVPYVVEPMGMFRPIDRSLRFKRLWHGTLGKTFLEKAARVVVTSEIEEKDLIEGGVPQEKLVLRYNGIDVDIYRPELRGTFRSKHGIPANEPIILFLSRLIPRKGADLLIKAFAEVCKDAGRLVIAGPEGELGYRQYLRTCANNTSAAGRILFTGPVYDGEKKSLLADSDVFVLPSRYENFANVAAEAMACEVPVIISNSCGIAALVQDEAGMVIAPTQEELTGALRQMVDDAELRARWKEGCQRVASRLNWDQLCEQMERCYLSAMQPAGTAQRPALT